MKVPEETARKRRRPTSKTTRNAGHDHGLGEIKAAAGFRGATAIAFASTVLGRRYVSSQRNWPSLFLLNIGKSASGKGARQVGRGKAARSLRACPP